MPRAVNRQDMLKAALPHMRNLHRDLGRIRNRYTDKDRDVILAHVWDRMAQGELIPDILTSIGLPNQTFYHWMNHGRDAARTAEYREAHARARGQLADWAFGEAYRVPRDLLKKIQSGQEVDSTEVTTAGILVKSLQWYAERLSPSQYGQQKQELAITGPNGGPLQVAAVTIDAASLSVDQREALRAALLGVQTPPALLPAASDSVDDSAG